MSVINNGLLLGAGADGYQISRSVRLRSSASAYLNRTFTTPTSNIKWTWSSWVKRGTIGAAVTNAFIGSALGGASTYFMFSFNGDAFDILQVTSGSIVARLTTSSVYRDPSSWYHVVMVWDSGNATSSSRLLLYVNGVQLTAFSTATYPSLNRACSFNASGTNVIGYRNYASDSYFDGYMTEINFVDGQQLTPSSFGETDTTTGVWKPKKYAGTYGTNGFYLNFSDNSGATATTIGKDYSGNGNNWTPNNISVTAGVTYDSMVDSPTVGATSSNYAVLNPLDKYSSTIGASEANLKLVSTSGGSYQQIRNTIGMSSGKYYMEWVIVSQGTAGRTGAALIKGNSPLSGAAGSDTYSWVNHGDGYAYYNNGTTALSTGSITTGTDVVMYAFDADSGKFWMGKNGTWDNSGNPATGANPIYSGLTDGPYFFGGWNYNTSDVVAFNFGQRPFSYTPPTGFVALNTQNLPAPTISNGANYMNASLWTGDASTPRAVVSNLAFSPDFVWTKDRSVGYQHSLQDTVRGTGASKKLYSSLTEAENGANSVYGHINSFDANGFTVATGSSGAQHVNASGVTYVGWSWKAGGTAVSNTAGTITSSVSANPTAGFSVVTYTGNGTNGATVGHGLGVVPNFVIVRARNNASNWRVWHTSLSANNNLYLNVTNAQDVITATAGGGIGTSPSSTTFTCVTGATANANNVNALTWTYVAYCFSEVAGYSKFGKYTGNGSADGPFVYCGFRPRFVMFKRTDASADWDMFDTSRNTYNLTNLELNANLSGAEFDTAAFRPIDILSNGFKLRGSNGGGNASGGTYIYMAFAENPFKNSLAR